MDISFGLGLGTGLFFILLLTAIIAYVLLQETRAHMHWRGLVARGDVEAVRALMQAELDGWGAGRPPKGLPASIWSAVQTVQIVDAGPDWVWLSTGVEGVYTLADGERREVSSPLDEATKVAMKLGEMVLYDIPDMRLPHVQIDTYSTFRESDDRPVQRCILSAIIDREAAAKFDWDSADVVDALETFEVRWRLSEAGVAMPVEPLDMAAHRETAAAP